jgi:hypothetical protein
MFITATYSHNAATASVGSRLSKMMHSKTYKFKLRKAIKIQNVLEVQKDGKLSLVVNDINYI